MFANRCPAIYIKKTISGLLVLSLLVLSGCSDHSKPKTPGFMQIYVHSMDTSTMAAVSEFNENNLVQIQMTLIDDNDMKQIEETQKKLTAAILAGEGPDLIVDFPLAYPSLWKIASNKAFVELNEWIKQDKEFQMEDYFQKALAVGEWDSHRYFIPLSFKVPYLWLEEKKADNELIELAKAWNWNDFSRLFKSSVNGNSVDAGSYFIANSFDFTNILMSSWHSFVDYEKRLSHFDTEKFRELLQLYKEMSPAILTDMESVKQPDLYFHYLKDEKLKFVNGVSIFNFMWTEYSASQNLLHSSIKVLPYPTIQGADAPSGQVQKFAAISANSQHKKEAFLFIKLLLSEKYQTFDNQSTYMPVNIKAYKSKKAEVTGEKGSEDVLSMFSTTGSYNTMPLPENLLQDYENVLDYTDITYMDSNIIRVVNEEMESYLAGKQDVNKTSKSIQDRVQLYLNE